MRMWTYSTLCCWSLLRHSGAMGSVGPVVLLVALVDGERGHAQEKVLAPLYDVYAVRWGRGVVLDGTEN